MLTLQVLTLSLAAAVLVSGQTVCPEIPDTGVSIGEPVPIRPEDVPRGCSAHEILVGKSISLP